MLSVHNTTSAALVLDLRTQSISNIHVLRLRLLIASVCTLLYTMLMGHLYSYCHPRGWEAKENTSAPNSSHLPFISQRQAIESSGRGGNRHQGASASFPTQEASRYQAKTSCSYQPLPSSPGPARVSPTSGVSSTTVLGARSCSEFERAEITNNGHPVVGNFKQWSRCSWT